MNKRNVYVSAAATLAMIFCIAIIMAITYREISNLAMADCFQDLWDQTDQMREELKEKVDGDSRLLENMSEVIAGMPTIEGEEAQEILAFERTGNLVERVELFFPDGRIMGTDGFYSGDSQLLNYEETAARGVHFTGRYQDNDSEEWILYHIVPVQQKNETVALLCGRISLTKLQEEYRSVLEGNGSRLYLIEANSREFLVDTMHDILGTTEFTSKISRAGDSVDDIQKNMVSGIPGQFVFYSNTAQEDMFGVYEPVGIQDWTVMLGVPKSIAFNNAVKIKLIFFLCVAMEALVLIIYFIMLLSRSRKLTAELEKQYDISQRVREIQERLFYSILNPDQRQKALHEMAKLLDAQSVFLFMKSQHNRPCILYSSQMGEKKSFSREDFPALMKSLTEQGKIYFRNLEELNAGEDEKEQLRQNGIYNGMAITLMNMDNKYQGILFAVNITRDWKKVEPLEWMRYDFSMALDSMEAFQRIKELGSKDQLTGLLNRNSYQKAMEFYEKMGEETLNCVYIDVDGLHELNNQLGHAEGDRMLMAISHFLQEIFGDETVYRIGGDEFLIFCCGIEEPEMERKLKELHGSVEDAGYHISLGLATRRETPLVYEMVRLAESRMYEAKRQYYRERKDGQKVREMNHQLEATLLEKRDLDVFCTVLSYRYVGVYIVDLSLDATRAINIPDYFVRDLEQTGGKFSEAIRIYMQEMVLSEYHTDFEQLLDYEKLYQQLSAGKRQETVYRKMDGNILLLRIYPTPDFDEFQKECIWTFEVLEKGGGKLEKQQDADANQQMNTKEK